MKLKADILKFASFNDGILAKPCYKPVIYDAMTFTKKYTIIISKSHPCKVDMSSTRYGRLITNSLLLKPNIEPLWSAHPRLSSTWEGRQTNEHVTNNEDKLNVQSSASLSGKNARAKRSEQSSSVSEKDHGKQNTKAEKDHPEAPAPVIGMNDERGQVIQIALFF